MRGALNPAAMRYRMNARRLGSISSEEPSISLSNLVIYFNLLRAIRGGDYGDTDGGAGGRGGNGGGAGGDGGGGACGGVGADVPV